MPKLAKFLIGLALALAAGAISHGPLGRGAAFIDGLDAELQAILKDVALPGVNGAIQREPLSRRAILSGPADRFQREGVGSLPGLDERVLSIPGMGRVEWTNPPPA
jgi:hypothetical protein